MTDSDSSNFPGAGVPTDSIRGRTIRWTWTEGPVEGVTREQLFRTGGSAEWRVLSGPRQSHSALEQEYAVLRVSERVCALSYAAASGYELTVVLNLETGQIFGFVSGQERSAPGAGDVRGGGVTA